MNDDQTFLDIIDFGYTQTQLESPIGEQPTPSTQHQATPITEKAKSNKGKNWSSEEDKILIAAWGNTSLDSVETDQNRDANAINCRYTLINKETARFCGCLQQILNREESGRTIEEKVCVYLVLLYVLCNILYVMCRFSQYICMCRQTMQIGRAHV